MRLRQYDPANGGAFSTVLAEPVVLPWSERALWSPDRRTLTLAIYRGGPDDELPPELVLITPGQTLATRVLPASGYAPAFSPAGDRLAIFSGGDPFLGLRPDTAWRLNLIDLQPPQLTTVLTAAEIAAAEYSQVGGLDWSADGRWLTFLLVGASGGPLSYLAAADGSEVRALEVGRRNGGSFPLGFSADSRYLAVLVFGGAAATNQIFVFDLSQPGAPAQRYLAQTAAWSADGHELLMGGAAGIFAVDPATNVYHWLYDTTCALEIT
jgi:Tol biopolymer transport system component